MNSTEWVLVFLLLGCFVRFIAELLGIGGDGIMMPVLTLLFLLQGVPVEKVVHMALRWRPSLFSPFRAYVHIIRNRLSFGK
jgi:uncharacterized membrane protein YfcA